MPVRFSPAAARACIGAALALSALSACLDNSSPMPVSPGASGTPGTSAPPAPRNRVDAPKPPMDLPDPASCRALGPSALLDSSLRAWRRLEGHLHGAYAYTRVRVSPVDPSIDSTLDSTVDSTRIVFAGGRAAARETWATLWMMVFVDYVRVDSSGGVVSAGHPPATRERMHACEQEDIGFYHYGDPAVPLDSLYAECADIVHRDPAGARVSVDADFLLMGCAPGPAVCPAAGAACPAEIRISRIEWPPEPPGCLLK